MASYPVFSGDMAALNQGFAAQEDADIRRRAATQNYLATLSGQMQQANIARGAQEAALRQAEMANATQRQQIQSQQGLGMRGFDVQESLGQRGLDLQSRAEANRNANALLALNQQYTRDLATIDNEGRRLSILAAQGDRQAQLESDRLQVTREQIQAQKDLAERQIAGNIKIAQIGSGGFGTGSMAVEVMRQNERTRETNDLAKAMASELQDKVTKASGQWNPFVTNVDEVTPDQVAKGMTPEQRAMVQYDPKTKTFVPRLRAEITRPNQYGMDGEGFRDQPGQGTGSTLLDVLAFAYKNSKAGAAKSPATGGKKPDASGVIPANALIPGVSREFTNAPLASLTNQPPAGVTNRVASAASLPPVGDSGSYADQGPASWSMAGPPQPRGYLSGLTVDQRVEPVSAAPVDYQPIPQQSFNEIPQGPPQRIYNPRFRVPLGASSDPNFNPAVGSYFSPGGSYFSEPLFRRQQQVQQPSMPAPMDYLPTLQQLTGSAQQSFTNTFNPARRYEILNHSTAY